MIRALITETANAAGSDLTRLLVHHPEVEIVGACTAGDAVGRPVSDLVSGLIGDTRLRVSGKTDTGNADVIFVTGGGLPGPGAGNDLRIIDLRDHSERIGDEGGDGYVCGVPELYRKAMVRGARCVSTPSPFSLLTATALLPTAKNLLLNGVTDVTVCGAEVLNRAFDIPVIHNCLRELQRSYEPQITICAATSPRQFTDMQGRNRFMRVDITTSTAIDDAHLQEMYHDFFDDHNFVHIIDRDPVPADVIGTNKLILSLGRDRRDSGRIHITGAIDPVLKGGAGNAVHCMNLLFGLYERTGLELSPFA